jgi:hypothetical protein
MSTKGAAAKKTRTYEKIEARLANLDVKLADHIDPVSSLVAHERTLDGINFTPKKDPKTKKPSFLEALRRARDTVGQPAFAEGSKFDHEHWALQLSYKATEGRGFREIWRLRLTDRPLRWTEGRPGLNVPSFDAGLSAHFGDNPTMPDLSSLHCAVTDGSCNVHIDEMGFVMETPSGGLAVDPDFLRHTLIELIWKTKLKGKIPDWAVERVNFIVPSSYNNYSRVGISFDLARSETVKLSVNGSCGVLGGFNCSGTLNLTGSHDVLGGGR